MIFKGILSLMVLVGALSTHASDLEIFDLSLEELLAVRVSKSQSYKIFFSNENPPTDKSVNIGLIVPFSTYQKYSTELIAAAELAAKDINENGGVLGRPVVIIRGDNAATRELSVSLAKEMIDKYKVAAIITPGSSDYTMSIARDIAIAKNTPLFAPASNANILSHIEDNDLLFRLAPTNRQITGKLIEFLEKRKLNKVAVFHERDTFGNEIAGTLQSMLPKIDKKIVYRHSLSHLIDYQLFDMKMNIEEIQNSGAEAIVLPLRPQLLREFIKNLNRVWKGKMPVLLLPEHQFTNGDIQKSNRAVCAFAISPLQEIKNASILKSINMILKSSRSSYTSVFVNDIVYLVSASRLYSELNKLNFIQSLRKITESEQPILATELYQNPKSFYSKNEQASFQGGSGMIHFDQAGDNTVVGLSAIPVHQIYGSGCDKYHD